MTESAAVLWDEMLEEFRAVGGVAENVRLGEGRFGRGLFAIDPATPIKLHIPKSLLVEVKDVEFHDNAFRVGPGARIGAREKAFLKEYERNFSWGSGHAETAALLQMMHEAPAELREFLRNTSMLEWWLAGPSDSNVQQRFLYSRCIGYGGRQVVMPVVELANHGILTQYVLRDGVGLQGTFAGEILVQYDICDPLEVFDRWGFVADEEAFALSLAITLPNQGLAIARRPLNRSPERKPFFPDIAQEDGRVTFSCMLLGHRRLPRLPRGNFYRAMREAGRGNADEAFDAIQHINRMQFYRLLELVESASEPLRGRLQKPALRQLEAMSHNIGTREV